jgi:uncharacterized RDD family membrane protein YckC
MNPEEKTEDLLTNFETRTVRASAGKRFANYVIDYICFLLLFMLLGVAIIIVAPSTADWFDDSGLGGLLDRLLSLILYALYMFAVEAIFKGKSIGKLITGTRAVNLDGSPISTTTALARGFSRAVPFCAFSALGTPCNPWHDKWNDTLVIDEKQSDMRDLIQ